jgi:hypothetical protein
MMTDEQKIELINRWKYSDQGMTLEEFTDSAQPTIGMDDAIVVKWSNMWLAIEADGYTHS